MNKKLKFFYLIVGLKTELCSKLNSIEYLKFFEVNNKNYKKKITHYKFMLH